MGGLQSTERPLSATASKGLSALRAAPGLCCAVNQRLTSVVREICTLRSVGAGGFGPWRPGGTGNGSQSRAYRASPRLYLWAVLGSNQWPLPCEKHSSSILASTRVHACL